MIYIDNNSELVYFPRIKEIATKVICINQVSKIEVEVPVLEVTGRYYVVNFKNWINSFENGQYDYIFRNDEDKEILSGILQFGEYNSNPNTNYEVDVEFIQYTPSEN